MKHLLYGGILLFILLLNFGINTPTAQAIGLGISPANITLNNIIKGTQIERVITLNRSDTTDDIYFNFEYEFTPSIAQNWVTINDNLPLIFKQGENQLVVKIALNIPQSADQTDYDGRIRFLASKEKNTQNNVDVLLNALFTLNFNVSETIVDEYEIENIEINNFEESYELPLTISINNQGNIPAQPDEITLDFYDQNKSSLIKSLTIDDFAIHEQVSPFTEGRLRLKVKTDLKTGQYWADVKIIDNDEILKQKEIIFSVVELNGINREALIDNLTLEPDPPRLNTPLTISGDLTNTGKTKIKPKVIIDVYRNNILIDILENKLSIINPGQVENFKTELTPNNNGNYELRAKAEFSGLQTQDKIITFSINSNKTNGLVLVGSIGIFFILVIFIYSLQPRSKRKKRTTRGRGYSRNRKRR